MDESHQMFYKYKHEDFYWNYIPFQAFEILETLIDKHNGKLHYCKYKLYKQAFELTVVFNDSTDNLLFRYDLMQHGMSYDTTGIETNTAIEIIRP